MSFLERIAAAVVVVMVALAPWTGAHAQLAGGPRKPLLIEGKTTLYQRVLTRPGAAVSARPGGAAGKELPPMTLLFVYGKQAAGATSYLEVGANSEGRVIGFLPEADTIQWKHSLTLAFTNPANRQRVLFFKDRVGLVDMLNSDRLLVEAEQIRKQIEGGKLPPGSPVISIEPETFVDMQKQFYLLPILDAGTTVLKSGFKIRTVQVASVTKEKGVDTLAQVSQRSNPEADLAKFTSGVVFVIDASASMQPYIDLTRAAMEEVYQQVEAAKLQQRLRFGMVAYRDDPMKVKGIEYLVRTFADPTKVSTQAQFADAVKGVAASEISTRAFAEDGYAGLVEAIQGIDWTGFGGRYLIMITDASSREGNSPLSTTGLGTEQVRQLALENRIATYVLYLKTPEGREDHARAIKQYEALANYPNVGSLFFPVEAGDKQAFRSQVQRLAEALVNQVRSAGQKPASQVSGAAAAGAGDKIT